MKKFSLICLSLLSFNAMALDRLAFTGEYTLEKAIVGTCPKEMTVVKDSFLNETSSPSISFYCEYNSGDCSGLVYQLPDINSGKIVNVQENPMSGFFDSIYYSHQTLSGNTITAENKSTNLFGKIHWQTNFKAVLQGKKLSYEFTEVNNIINEDRQSSCVYKRK